MARFKSFIKVRGTFDDVTFYKDKDGIRRMKGKSEITAEQIKSSPAFQRTRENMAEFGNAAKAGKLIRTSIKDILKHGKDHRVVSRLTQRLMEILKTDTISPRGERQVKNGNPLLLKDFEFNVNAPLSPIFSASLASSVVRSTGVVTLSISAYSPGDLVETPIGATHYRIVSAAVELDFGNQVKIADVKASDYKVWNNTPVVASTVEHQLSVNSTLTIMTVVGIQFFQETNGNFYLLKNGAFNGLQIIAIDPA